MFEDLLNVLFCWVVLCYTVLDCVCCRYCAVLHGVCIEKVWKTRIKLWITVTSAYRGTIGER